MRQIYRAANLQDAHIVRDHLRQESIPCEVRGQNLAGALGELPAQDTAPTLWVPAERAVEARKIIDALEVHRQTANKLPHWKCNHCGEDNEGQFLQCWSCCKDK